MALILDIEADGLIATVSKAWIIGWYDTETKKVEYWHNGDLGWKEKLASADRVVGHNIVGYDLLVLKKLFNFDLPKAVEVYDTFIVSLILDYNRFPLGRHSLRNWGISLGQHKLDFEDFSQWSEEMQTYWEQDIRLTHEVYNTLERERSIMEQRNPRIVPYIAAEHAVAKWCAQAEYTGWPFDLEGAKALLAKMEAERQEAFDALLPKLGTKTVALDKKNGVVETKKPKTLKDGRYDAFTCRWFGIDEWSNFDDDRLVDGEYCRVAFVPLDLNSVSDVKIFLDRNGWVPTEWNTKPNPEGKGVIKTSPKITEDSLEFMGEEGKLYLRFLSTSSRAAILRTWIENTDSNLMLHGQCATIGTPSMRARHSIIVNVPSVDAPWGKEMRALFGCKEGWALIGADSSGNQARGLAHYLKSAEYIDLLLNGDIHQYNADRLTEVLANMKIDYKVPRSAAKRVLYAALFGASGAKLWSYIFNNLDDKQGKVLKNGFYKSIPGFKKLLEKLENIYGKTKQDGKGYIPGIAGNRIYCDSFHKLLVYLLQSCEKATCAAAVMITMETLEREKIPYIPLIMYHDEIEFMVPEEYAERAAEISKNSFKEGPKLFGIQIMDGASRIGKTWLDVH